MKKVFQVFSFIFAAIFLLTLPVFSEPASYIYDVNYDNLNGDIQVYFYRQEDGSSIVWRGSGQLDDSNGGFFVDNPLDYGNFESVEIYIPSFKDLYGNGYTITVTSFSTCIVIDGLSDLDKFDGLRVDSSLNNIIDYTFIGNSYGYLSGDSIVFDINFSNLNLSVDHGISRVLFWFLKDTGELTGVSRISFAPISIGYTISSAEGDIIIKDEIVGSITDSSDKTQQTIKDESDKIQSSIGDAADKVTGALDQMSKPIEIPSDVLNIEQYDREFRDFLNNQMAGIDDQANSVFSMSNLIFEDVQEGVQFWGVIFGECLGGIKYFNYALWIFAGFSVISMLYGSVTIAMGSQTVGAYMRSSRRDQAQRERIEDEVHREYIKQYREAYRDYGI